MIKEKKEKILKCAEFLFATKGFYQTTVAGIAKESGINEASVYSYFGNRKNILFAIYGRYLKNAFETLSDHFQGMKEPGPKLRKAIWHYLADMQNNPNYAKILIMAQRENPDFYASEHFQYLKRYSNLVLDVIIEGQKEGFFHSDISARAIRNMAMGTSVYTAIESVVNNHPFDPNVVSDLIYQLVVNAAGSEVRYSGSTERITKGDRAKRRMARQANLGDATLYEYFENKEAILRDIAKTHLKRFGSNELIPFEETSDPERALKKLIWQFVWQVYTFEDFSRILILELFRSISFYSSPEYEYIEAFYKKILETIREGQRQGIFIEEVPMPIYPHMIVGTFDQFLLSQFLLNRPPLGLSELNDIVDALIQAIRIGEGV
ncbi:MAG: TetR/AcrR family transcriptional regulator [Deltaproteobacteria bacterium]|nr:TetR/AcrR family transcriptional regulator [Deltaproteobacteria bacterium]